MPQEEEWFTWKIMTLLAANRGSDLKLNSALLNLTEEKAVLKEQPVWNHIRERLSDWICQLAERGFDIDWDGGGILLCWHLRHSADGAILVFLISITQKYTHNIMTTSSHLNTLETWSRRLRLSSGSWLFVRTEMSWLCQIVIIGQLKQSISTLVGFVGMSPVWSVQYLSEAVLRNSCDVSAAGFWEAKPHWCMWLVWSNRHNTVVQFASDLTLDQAHIHHVDMSKKTYT